MRHRLVLALALAGSVHLAAAGDDGLSVQQFQTLHGELTASMEPWQDIPWHVSLLEARSQAAKEKKPIYMLCRAGHPLGCV
jgi:hypothetical protein